MDPNDEFLVLDGLRFHYIEWSTEHAAPLVILHGITSQAGAWSGLARSLSDRFRVIALDQRGHGRSDWADDYSYGRLVKDLEAFVAALGLSTFRLLGHSLGGRVALLYTATHPPSVERLVISDTGPEPPPDSVIAAFAVTAELDFASVEEAVRALHVVRGYASNVIPTDVVRQNLKQREDGRWVWRYDPNFLAKHTPPEAAEFWVALRKIACPTLIVRGGDSVVLARSTAERMAREIPNGTLVEIEGAGHRLFLEKPGEYAEAVRSFLT